jgi:hypothetical protein
MGWSVNGLFAVLLVHLDVERCGVERTGASQCWVVLLYTERS